MQSVNGPPQDRIARSVRATLELLGDRVSASFVLSLKIRGKLDIDNVRTMEDIGIFEGELRTHFGSGANVLIARLHAELDDVRSAGRETVKNSKASLSNRRSRPEPVKANHPL